MTATEPLGLKIAEPSRFKRPPLTIHQLTRWNKRHGIVYFFREAREGLIKIGFTSGDPQRRLAWAVRSVRTQVEWIGYFRATAVDEIAAHRRFGELHVRNEWFSPAPALLAWMKRKSPQFDEEKALQELFDLELTAKVKAITAHRHQRRLEFFGLMQDAEYFEFLRWINRRQIPSAELLREARRALRKFHVRLEAIAA